MEDVSIGEKIYLKQTDFETWINTRDSRYSKEAFEFDPHMPYPADEDEKMFYEKNVKTNYHLIYEIHYIKNNELLGFIVAFDFKKMNSTEPESFKFNAEGGICETGIGIFKTVNFSKGYGKESYELFFRLLKFKYNITKTFILTHPDNERAKGLYNKLGFKETGIFTEEGKNFLRMEYELVS